MAIQINIYLNKLQLWTFILVWTDLNPHTNYLNKIFKIFLTVGNVCWFSQCLDNDNVNVLLSWRQCRQNHIQYTACAQPLCNLPTLKNALKSSLAHFWYEEYQQFKNAWVTWKFDSDKSEQKIKLVTQRGTDAY